MGRTSGRRAHEHASAPLGLTAQREAELARAIPAAVLFDTGDTSANASKTDIDPAQPPCGTPASSISRITSTLPTFRIPRCSP